MHKSISIRARLAAGAVLLITLACAGTPAGVPDNSPEAFSTIVAGTMAAIQSQTPPATDTQAFPTISIPTAGVSTSIPPTLQAVSPTQALPSASRILFLDGATTGSLSSNIQPGQALVYVLQAAQGQIMMVNVDSQNQDVIMSIKTQGGTSMLNASARQATWQQSLPQTEDYYITIYGGAAPENFTLTITIPSRIQFAEGAFSAKVTGKTAGGYSVHYVLFAIKDQKMSVELSGLSGEAALTIYGYTDGNPYVRSASEQTSYSFTLPSTQDYIIEVVPKAGSVVSYLLTVKIQ